MQVVSATPTHLDECRSWIERRGLPMPPTDVFSSTGFVAPGVAAVWLYLTGSSMAYMDHLIGNPDVSTETRSAGLDAVLSAAIAAARNANVRILLAMVDNPRVEARLLDHDLAVINRGLAYMSINLGEPSCPG